MQDLDEHVPDAVLPASSMLGSICDPDRGVDFAMCALLVEVHEYAHVGASPVLVGTYFLVDGISREDAWDVTCLFHDATELLVDVGAIDGICSSRLLIPSIKYTDDPEGYLAMASDCGLLLSLPDGGLIHRSSWLAYGADRISSDPVGHACMRRRMASSLGLPHLPHYDLSTEEPMPVRPSDVDESYLALVVSDAVPVAVPTPPDARAVEDRSGAVSSDAAPSDAASEPKADAAEAAVDPAASAAVEPDPAPADDPAAQASSAVPVPAVRTMRVARAPATGRRSFPAVSGALEKGVPLHGTDGTDVSPVTSALADLRRSVPWMSNVVDVVEEEVLFAWASGSPMKRVHPILMSGPSGAGKTRFARMLAKALDLRFSSISLAGSTDNRNMEGTTVGWMNARASWPSLTIADRKSANPMLLVDEVEKVDSTYNGDPRRTLVTMLDPETNHEYHDVGLDCAVDLSCVSWVLCCNEHRQLDVALRDRLRVLEVVGPSAEHLPLIVDQAMRDVGDRMGVDASRLPDMGDLMLSKAKALFRTSKSMRSVVRCVDDMVRHRVVADARRGVRLPPVPLPAPVESEAVSRPVEGQRTEAAG